MSPVVLVLVHAAATLFMAGLVWFVQVVHYPLFAQVGRGDFPAYEDRHRRRTTRVVAPPMLLELGTTLALLVDRPAAVPPALVWTGAALLGVIWLSTVLLQVPRHDRLRRGFVEAAHEGLVATNWIRTIAWTARAVLALAMVAALLPRAA